MSEFSNQYYKILEAIISHPENYKWEIQGFGMLRTYLDKETRLQIWSNNHSVPNVSAIHNHPWDFTSHILYGELTNVCYKECIGESGEPFYKSTIITGKDAYQGTPEAVKLLITDTEVYRPGDHYEHKKEIVHTVNYLDGTVTLIKRYNRDKSKMAHSYWSRVLGENGWVSAAPRIPSMEEVLEILNMINNVKGLKDV